MHQQLRMTRLVKSCSAFEVMERITLATSGSSSDGLARLTREMEPSNLSRRRSARAKKRALSRSSDTYLAKLMYPQIAVSSIGAPGGIGKRYHMIEYLVIASCTTPSSRMIRV